MTYRMAWARDDGEEGMQLFGSQDEADQAAQRVAGVALVFREPGGPPTVFRDGKELEGGEASDAFAKFGHKIEVGVSGPEVPATDVDPGDLTASGFRPGSPAVYGWRVWKPGEPPGAWVGTFATPEAAVAAAEEARESNPELAGLPIVRVDR